MAAAATHVPLSLHSSIQSTVRKEKSMAKSHYQFKKRQKELEKKKKKEEKRQRKQEKKSGEANDTENAPESPTPDE